MSRSELVFRAVDVVSNRYMLVNRAAHLSKQLRHVYKDSTVSSISKALAKIAGVEEPTPLPSPSWKNMLSRHIALAQQQAADLAKEPETTKRRLISDEDRKEIIALASKGWTQAKIASQLGFSPFPVSRVLAENDAAIEEVLAVPKSSWPTPADISVPAPCEQVV